MIKWLKPKSASHKHAGWTVYFLHIITIITSKDNTGQIDSAKLYKLWIKLFMKLKMSPAL